MAYAILSSLAQTIHQILNHDQYIISDDEKQQITSLHKQVTFLREFLDTSPKEASRFEARIRDAANEAEDLLENFMYDQISENYKSTTAINPHQLHDLKRATEEINSISREAAELAKEDAPPLCKNPTSPAPAAGGVEVGLDEDFMKIADLLCGESSKRQVIPIVGMGGIGKTTLARKAYHHPLITERFPFRAWVTVSQDYKPQDVFLDLLHSLKGGGGDGSSGSSRDSMQDKLYKFLKGRKYLIVLDDVWNQKAWDDVKNFFPDDGNGSRVMITTRLADVAYYAESSRPLHRMRLMDGNQSWDLFVKKVFLSKDCPSDLEGMGKEIARKCGGLPLAVVLVAGILSTVSETPLSWKEVAEKVDLAGELEEIISLSYTNLPHHLRACFLYMGGFPRNHDIRVSRLIKLWMAEGFVEPRGGKSAEEVAIEYLEDLVKRSLVLVRRKKSNGGIKTCYVHDLVRDICRRRAEQENFQRRISIAQTDPMFLARTYVLTLRSLISFYPSGTLLGDLPLLRLLRVLDVVDANVSSFPAQVFDLFHLRYLAFNCDTEIPTAISRLRNLRTLIICRGKRRRYSKDVLYLPVEIWMMPLLTHLVSFDAHLPEPEGVASPLEKLLTLSILRRFVCTKKMTQMIPNLKKLVITYLSEEVKEQDYQLNNLVLLRQLETLKLVLKADSFVMLKVNPVFPQRLRKLTLSGWRFPWKFMETVGSLPNLQVLKLRDHAFEGHTWETNEEQFPNLEFLQIDESDLEKWITEANHFPRLKALMVYHCYNLCEIPNDIGEIPTLQLIEFDNANESLVECIQRIREDQHDVGNNDLQFRSLRFRQEMVIEAPIKIQSDITQALKIAVSVSGVESAALSAHEKDRLSIVTFGYGVDAVHITKLLRERFGDTVLVSVRLLKN